MPHPEIQIAVAVNVLKISPLTPPVIRGIRGIVTQVVGNSPRHDPAGALIKPL
jgi:hypothetical protein